MPEPRESPRAPLRKAPAAPEAPGPNALVQRGHGNPLLADEGEDAAPARWDCPFCGHELHGGVERCAACGALAVPPDAVAIDALRANARTVYLLQAITPLCGVSAVAGLLLAYANRGQARDTWLDSHYEWQIESFWGLFWFALAALGAGWVGRLAWGAGGTWLTLAGLTAASAWFIHRVVKGWTRLGDGDPVREW